MRANEHDLNSMRGMIRRLQEENASLKKLLDENNGGMNLLGKADIYDNLIRVENEQAAVELLEMTEQMGNRSV